MSATEPMSNIFDTLKSTYNFFSDPQHGWLQVKHEELVRLGIAQLVSTYSYIDGRREYVYLEEDSDAGKFLRAKDELGEPFKFIESYTDNASPIRKLDRYVA
jgi:hypothetical protein